MNWREILIGLILLAAAVLLWQLLDQDSINTNTDAPPEEAVAGYYLQGTELIRYDKEGQPLFTIEAERIEQNPLTNELILSDLSIKYSNNISSTASKASPPWQINADNASLPQDRQSIRFKGNVVAKQLSKHAPVSFRTERLQYDVERQRLQTSARVFTRKGLRSIQATGMTIDMQKEQVRLHSKVKIRIQVQ